MITVSPFSRNELKELLDVEAEVVYGGVDPRFTPDAEPARRERPYVLCVASHTARKNLKALVPAAAALAREGVDLVVAGGHRPQFAAEAGLDGLHAARPRPGRRSCPASTPAPRRSCCRRLYEGFGLPVLEAMACGHARRRRRHDRAARHRAAAPRASSSPSPEALREALIEPARRRRRARAAARARPRARPRVHVGADRARGRRDRQDGGHDAAQRRREAQRVQARLRGRLGLRDALLGHDGVRRLYDARVEPRAGGVLELHQRLGVGELRAAAWRSARSRCPPPRRSAT